MITVHHFTFNAFQENTYILFDETKEAIILDPGCFSTQEKAVLQSFISEKELQVVRLLNTHCHIDHVLGNYFVKETYNVKLETHRIESEQLNSVPLYAPSYGFHSYEATTVDSYIDEKSTIQFGNSALQTFFVPGHSPGHLVFYAQKDGFCINGDVLFKGSIGRTDLPGGDYQTLAKSIQEVMYQLPDETKVYCGHGSATTVGDEKRSNPFIRPNFILNG